MHTRYFFHVPAIYSDGARHELLNKSHECHDLVITYNAIWTWPYLFSKAKKVKSTIASKLLNFNCKINQKKL